jgi:hypothetical protein
MPAPTKRAAKSRRVMSPGFTSFVGCFFWLSVVDSPATILSLSGTRPHPRNVCLLRLAFFLVLGEIDNFDFQHQFLYADLNHLSLAMS